MTGSAPADDGRVVGERGDNALVMLQEGRSKLPLVCVHAEAGHLRLFENLVRHLGPDHPVYGLRGVAQDRPPYRPYRSFEEMANRYMLELSELKDRGPYVIVGECTGGELAYALAQQLETSGKQVALLALVDSFAPGDPRLVVRRRAYGLVNSLRMLAFHASAVARIGASDRRAYVATRIGRIVARLRTRVASRGGPPPTEILRQQAFREARDAYRPGPYAGRIALFRGSSLPWGARTSRDLGWARVAAEVEITELPTYFGTCILEPEAGRLAQALEHAAAVWTGPDPTRGAVRGRA